MYHEADSLFWETALKDFPILPHLTEIKIIYHYPTYKGFNTSCWDQFSSILSNQAKFPRLERADICITIRSQAMGYRNLSAVVRALSTFKSSGRQLTYWGKAGKVFFCHSNVKLIFPNRRLALRLVFGGQLKANLTFPWMFFVVPRLSATAINRAITWSLPRKIKKHAKNPSKSRTAHRRDLLSCTTQLLSLRLVYPLS